MCGLGSSVHLYPDMTMSLQYVGTQVHTVSSTIKY
eukprot:SAG31_NODE_40648_length_279_cov_1.733333_1_plen_34_part_01